MNAEQDQLSDPAWLAEHGYVDGPTSDVGHVGGFFVCADLSVCCSVVTIFSEFSGFILIFHFCLLQYKAVVIFMLCHYYTVQYTTLILYSHYIASNKKSS